MFIEEIAIFCYWTWFIWPFVFLCYFGHWIASLLKEDEPTDKIDFYIAASSLLIMLAGVLAPGVS